MAFETMDAFYNIKVWNNERTVQEIHELESAHNEHMDFIIRSVKQMADFVQNCHLQSGVLRTPSRRVSKRKRSSVVIMSVKTKNVSAATPRRLSKRSRVSKRITLKLDSPVIEMEVCEEVAAIPVNEVTVQPIVDNDVVDNPVAVEPVVDTILTAQELMSELSIQEVPVAEEEMKDKKIKENAKHNESDNEWMTDDEEGPQKNSAEVSTKAKPQDSNNTSVDNKSLSASISKAKKKSLYFTPQTTLRSTRAQTRMLSRIADSSMKTPQTSATASRLRDSSQKTVDKKALTQSALKKRQEAEEERRKKLLASQEKEKMAIERRRLLLQQKVEEKRCKSQEKAIRAAELREQQKQLEAQRLKQEWMKREEIEKKREAERLEHMKNRQQELYNKAKQMEQRKQMNEMNKALAEVKKHEEIERKQELEKERQKERERVANMITQHNSSLQQKAVANSFIKKTEVTAQSVVKVMVTKMTPSETAKHMANIEKVSPTIEVNESKPANNTFVVPKEDELVISSYDMTPPPKEHNYDNYDISQIQSDDDTDDDEQPRKQIPSWARGQEFIKQIHKQHGRGYRRTQRHADQIFDTASLLNRFKTDFDRIFPKASLHPRFAKRTSSAVWDESPLNYSSIWEESILNESLCNE